MNDEFFMKAALIQAKFAFEKQEVPVGAVLVYQGNIIAAAHNQVESLKDATKHAEILCLQQASEILDNWRLLETTLYCTLEPCSMCAGAMALSRVKRLVWAAPDLRHGANGSLFNFFEVPHPTHHVEITSGILKEESAELMKAFFKQQRTVLC